MGKSIVITSGKGGVGKTTVTANVGNALSRQDKKVVLVEGDIGLNNLDVVTGINDRIIYDIGDVIANKCSLAQALVSCNDSLYVLPSTSLQSVTITTAQFGIIINDLKEVFDYVFIDCPAGVEGSFHRAVNFADEAVVVTTPHLSSIRDAYKVQKLLSAYKNIQRTGLVVNRVKGEYVADNLVLDAGDIAKELKSVLIGVIPEDDFINLYGLADPADNSSGATYSYFLIASYLDGGDKKIYDCVSKYRSIFSRLARRLKNE